MRTWFMAAAAAALLGLVLAGDPVSGETPRAAGDPGVCQPQDEHRYPPNETTTSMTVVAPDGKSIVGYCVKAGSIHQNLGPEYTTLPAPSKTVTISHSSGKDISHYVLTLVPVPVPDDPVIPPDDPVIPPDDPVIPPDDPVIPPDDPVIPPDEGVLSAEATAPTGATPDVAPATLPATGGATLVMSMVGLVAVAAGSMLIRWAHRSA